MAGNREIVEAVTDELRRVGASEIEYRHEGRGHPRVWFSLNGRRRYKVVPGTSSDVRNVRKAIADVRRLAGVQTPEKAVSGPRRGRKKVSPAPAPECPAITVKPDPWRALGTLRAQMQETSAIEPRPPLWRRLLAWLR